MPFSAERFREVATFLLERASHDDREALERTAVGRLYYASFLRLRQYLRNQGIRATTVGTVVSAMPVIDSISGMPVSIAGVGVREKLFEVLMRDLAGVPPETAVAASLAGFACNALWAGLGALFFLKKNDRVTVAELEADDD